MEKKSPYYLFRRVKGDGTRQKSVFKIRVDVAVGKTRENLRKSFKIVHVNTFFVLFKGVEAKVTFLVAGGGVAVRNFLPKISIPAYFRKY